MTDEHEHSEIHLPPNSWTPLSLALALAFTFVGFLVHPVMWIIGLIWVIGSCVAWFLAARTEYRELPDSLDASH